MSRPLRVAVVGGWYHVTARGTGRQRIFLDDRDREHALEVLAELPERFGVEIHVYVLMDNHFPACRPVGWMSRRCTRMNADAGGDETRSLARRVRLLRAAWNWRGQRSEIGARLRRRLRCTIGAHAPFFTRNRPRNRRPIGDGRSVPVAP
jgi:hypothetical protein